MQENAFSKSAGPASSAGLGQSYFTRDLMTDPPTIIQIIPAPSEFLIMQRLPSTVAADTFKISFDDIEPTAGWLSDRNNASLDICFMHSFGKCFGKIREKDSKTCHQIHVKREILDNLRKYYVNPQRHYFCRTMKANVTEKFAQVLSLLARRRIALQYLEFRTDDIEVTAGSMEYEVEYRHWLVSDAGTQRKISANAANVTTDNFFSSSNLCWDFALTGRCSRGVSCPNLHGHVAKALTKDRVVKTALAEMGKKESWAVTGSEAPPSRTAASFHMSTLGAAPPLLPPPPPPMPPPQGPPFMMSSPLPPYSFAPECAAPGPRPPAMAAFPLDMTALQGAPCFFVSEGNDNVFRLITQPQFSPFNTEGVQQIRN
ncbi:hypothetical protein ABB37_01033 [Leptomonas pyrrhocoris]|uniref:C3H1-type domain-containing protein n=1 Tax=Leptomonas pyrrhocoris TaxID=157538 RepID=A0A0N0VH39_LEPPY|nr:hypothetical protein ABB37_01033 [Leptomonas pyrrhocoris]KPA84478.1 hypothetical protein ABB37_01033 [Leptomonas pyrrhocoris]|eukprot:XP_015662917.1 hypothetical protein ABB37_01033 [Leptomonas pyrrhocoris]